MLANADAVAKSTFKQGEEGKVKTKDGETHKIDAKDSKDLLLRNPEELDSKMRYLAHPYKTCVVHRPCAGTTYDTQVRSTFVYYKALRNRPPTSGRRKQPTLKPSLATSEGPIDF